MNQPQLGSYEHIALSAIRPSTTNPRKHFDPAALEELTQSVRAMGVTVPILVRPSGTYGVGDERVPAPYEIVTGERRFRAAQAVGLETIPSIIQELYDDEARDLQMVENLQRADLHPIEEAEGYRALMASGTASLEDVAKKAGKTMGYVAQRMKLLNLELPAKTLFHAGHLTLGHALHLARLTPVDQDRATRELTGLNHLPKKADMVAEVTKMADNHRERGNTWRLVKQTEAELRGWIATHVLLSLDKVPWSLADPSLVPEAGACTTCPKRTGSNAALFADLTAAEDVCMDPLCFGAKQKAVQTVAIAAAAETGQPLLRLSAKSSHHPLGDVITEKTVLKAGQWLKAKARSCESVRKGILTDQPSTWDNELKGMKAGEVLTVCADQKCKVHKHTVEKKSAGYVNQNDPAVRKAREDGQKSYLANERPIRAAVIQAIWKSAHPGIGELRALVADCVQEHAAICRAMKVSFDDKANGYAANQAAELVLKNYIAGALLEGLAQIVLLDALYRTASPTEWMWDRPREDRKHLWSLAENYDVDADAIAFQIEAEREAAKPKVEANPVKAAVKGAAKKVSAETQAERKKAAAKKFPSKPKLKVKKLTAAQRKNIADATNKAMAERRKKALALDGKQKASGERAEAGVA